MCVGQWLWLVSVLFVMNTSGVVAAGHASALIYWDKCGFRHLLVFLFSSLLGAIAKLRKATISFVMSVCPSVRPRGTTRLPLDGF